MLRIVQTRATGPTLEIDRKSVIDRRLQIVRKAICQGKLYVPALGIVLAQGTCQVSRSGQGLQIVLVRAIYRGKHCVRESPIDRVRKISQVKPSGLASLIVQETTTCQG